MSQPTQYTRLYNFTDYQTVNPTKPLPATNLDAELNAVELTLDETLTNLALLQRDDGKLVNQLVTPESLSAATLAIISQGEYNPRGNWAASTAYAVGDLVNYNDATYLCLVDNTSTASFATDNSAGYWLLIANGALQGGGQAVDTFSGNAAQTTFTLSYAYASSNAATVFVAGVAQIPTQDFTIVGTTLTFVSAPPSPSVAGRKNIMVRGTGVEAQLAADLANTASADAQGYAAAALTSKNAAATSQTAAAASQTAAATSATAAAASQSAASTSQTAAATSATAAASSASAASTSQTAAATSATNAAASATSASTSATTATTKATEASTSATNAATSATSAAASATTATSKAADATTAANNAATSATAAGSSSTSAASSATSATNSATTATNAATTATQQASNASASATSANTSATNAATSATSAATSATAAATSAAAAAASQSAAATSEANAAASSVSAANSAAAAATALDNFDDRYLGPKANDPTLDNDGNALTDGALYSNTTTKKMRIYFDAYGWIDASSASVATLVTYEFVATTAAQTTFSGNDANGILLSYTVGSEVVLANGVKLKRTVDYTASNGSSIVLTDGLAIGQELSVLAFGAFAVANTYLKTEADAKFISKDSSTGAASMPVGTTAQRPETPTAGMYRMNTTTGEPEWYDASTSSWQKFRSRTYTADYLIVAGGGGGGSQVNSVTNAGGGGAGGLTTGALSLESGVVYPIVIGAGGAINTNGANSSITGLNISTISAIGGGKGGGLAAASAGGNGGSGGGGSTALGSGGSGTSGQGNAGGSGGNTGNYIGGGGGGAGASGNSGNSNGNGGVGVAISITGASVYYAGGGGGGGNVGSYGAGGLGGGGRGGTNVANSAVAGTANLGGGGGGSANNTDAPAAGGSGVVIIRYAGAQRGTGGTVTSAGGYTIHTFTSSGTFTA